jgi:hypothetical protein
VLVVERGASSSRDPRPSCSPPTGRSGACRQPAPGSAPTHEPGQFRPASVRARPGR